jgi:hypothetical protein
MGCAMFESVKIGQTYLTGAILPILKGKMFHGCWLGKVLVFVFNLSNNEENKFEKAFFGG